MAQPRKPASTRASRVRSAVRSAAAAVAIVGAVVTLGGAPLQVPDATEILTWRGGKRGAVSITFDDGSINQFRVAAPLLDERRLPGTFFLITGNITGSSSQARFVGRAPAEILNESATVRTNQQNYLERLSAAPFLGFSGLIGLRTSAARPTQQTYTRIDEAYAQARSGKLPALAPNASIYMDNAGLIQQQPLPADVTQPTWDMAKQLATRGHEIGSHTVMHARLDALDTANINYELETSRAEILKRLGPKHTFSAECPFGIEDERAMEHAFKVYPALRNRMPEPWLAELNRSSNADPTTAAKPYVQWQRGAIATTTPATIRGWIDRTAGDDNIWLVFVIHGVEGIGWEPVTSQTLTGMFDHLAKSQDRLWVATFGDVTKYMRERQNGRVRTTQSGRELEVRLTHSLDARLYDAPLTLRTSVPNAWTSVRVSQGSRNTTVPVQKDARGTFIVYDAEPGNTAVTLRQAGS
jgi:peptidoglycan/xylan/chitin deacetylase (PgdA/CDA1 family)